MIYQVYNNCGDYMNNYENIIKLYFKSMKSFEKIESTPRNFGTGDFLYSSEIHTLVAIGKHQGCNLTELAMDLNITKGGAGKFIKKLLNKDLIHKTQLPNNKKEVIFYMTDKGRIAYDTHELFEQDRFGKIFETLDSMEEKKVKDLEDFLKKLNEILDAGE